ncbi:hypothetical protein JCM3766R1_000391 [Sporobolomyces carnicolor]
MTTDDPTAPSQASQFGDPHTHSEGSSDRPGTQDALRGQGNSAARLGIPRDQVAPAADPGQAKSDSTLSKEDTSNAVGQKELNKEREIPNYITTGKDEREPTEGKLAQPPQDNNKSLVEAGTTMAGDADAYGGLEEKHQKNPKSHL